jgi:hypothetical protein
MDLIGLDMGGGTTTTTSAIDDLLGGISIGDRPQQPREEAKGTSPMDLLEMDSGPTRYQTVTSQQMMGGESLIDEYDTRSSMQP